jgi:hypothetical protein
MKLIILTIAIILSVNLYSQNLPVADDNTLYCVQILSTRNPQAFKFNDYIHDTIYIESVDISGITWYRLFVISDNQADCGMLHSYYSKMFGTCLFQIRKKQDLNKWHILDRHIVY